MITAEADSNDEQIQSSANVFLKSRQEACDKLNELYPDLGISVKLRTEIIEEFQSNLMEQNTDKGGETNGKLHNATS